MSIAGGKDLIVPWAELFHDRNEGGAVGREVVQRQWFSVAL